MSTRKHTPQTRGFRPEADDLESRQLLSGVVTGMDSKGDAFTLRLTGPGSLSVVKQNGPDAKPAALNSATDIATITIGGTDPISSRLVGTVQKGANSDGRVFFENLTGLAARSEQFPSAGQGILSIDMPNFWLAKTTTAAPTPTNPAPAVGITLPDGVETLRFGGVDAMVNRQAPSATFTPTSDTATVTLGLPIYQGSRIIIDRSVSGTQTIPAVPANGATPARPASTVQHGVVFAASGRLSLFQANEIDGDPATPPGPFRSALNPTAASTSTTGIGGTIVVSGTAGTSPFFTNAQVKGQATGQIGDLRVGGNATNLITLVEDGTNSGGDKISNFSIGGETNNILVVGPTGVRNVEFGKGMDKVEILTHVINTLKANRGALDSTVYVDRSISRIDFGGDVVNTQVLAGYQQSFSNIFTTILGINTSGNPFSGTSPGAPPRPLNAQGFGGLTAHVAGDVTNSVFAASVQPFSDVFGDPNQIVLTGGHIRGKIEGKVDNATATPNTPNEAFFAQKVDALSGPVVPPNVQEAPYNGPQQPTHLPGIRPAPGTARTPSSPAPIHATSVPRSSVSPLTRGGPTPKGPLASKNARH